MLKCAEFIEKLEKNEITDFTEYLENATIEYLVPMARRGIEVENLLKRGEETLVKTLIRNGHAQEYYDMWKHHSEPSVLIALAECGWFCDFFAKDKRCEIRAAAIVGNPSYIPKLMKRSATEREQCFKVLKQLKSPDPEILKAFMEYAFKDDKRYQDKCLTDQPHSAHLISRMQSAFLSKIKIIQKCSLSKNFVIQLTIMSYQHLLD